MIQRTVKAAAVGALAGVSAVAAWLVLSTERPQSVSGLVDPVVPATVEPPPVQTPTRSADRVRIPPSSSSELLEDSAPQQTYATDSLSTRDADDHALDLLTKPSMQRVAPHLRRPWSSISFEVFDEETNRGVTEFMYVVEVIGAPPERGSSAGTHRASAKAPLEMPFNLRIEAEGYEVFRMRQIRLREGYGATSRTIRLRRISGV